MPKNGSGRPPQSREVTISKALSFLLRHGAEKEGLKVNAQGYANVQDVLAWRKLRSQKVTFPEILVAVETSEKKRFALLHIPSAQEAPGPNTQSAVAPATGSPEESAQDVTTAESTVAAATTTEEQESATATALSAKDTDPSHFLIRATQGHSMKSVEAESLLQRLTLADGERLPDTVVHGTFHSAWSRILESEGLSCMGRNHVHFATGPALESVLPRPMDAPDALPRADSGAVISGMRRDAQVLIYIDIKRALTAGCPFWRSENGVILSEGMVPGARADGTVSTQKVVPLEFFTVVVERKNGLGKIWEDGKVLQELPAELVRKGNPKGKTVDSGESKGKERR